MAMVMALAASDTKINSNAQKKPRLQEPQEIMTVSAQALDGLKKSKTVTWADKADEDPIVNAIKQLENFQRSSKPAAQLTKTIKLNEGEKKRPQAFACRPWPTPVSGEIPCSYDDSEIVGLVDCLHCSQRITEQAYHIPMGKEPDGRYRLWRGGAFDSLSCAKQHLLSHRGFVPEKCLPLLEEMRINVYGEDLVLPAPERHLLKRYNIHGKTDGEFNLCCNGNTMVRTLQKPFVFEEMSIVEQQIAPGEFIRTGQALSLTQHKDKEKCLHCGCACGGVSAGAVTALTEVSEPLSAPGTAPAPQSTLVHSKTVSILQDESLKRAPRVYDTSLLPYGEAHLLTSYYPSANMD